jgi:hypothetical protein
VLGFGARTETTAEEKRGKKWSWPAMVNPRKEEKRKEREKRLTLRLRTARQW